MATEPIAQDYRRCSRCSQYKPTDRAHFSFIRCKDKWHPWCKECCAAQRREDRARRPDHYRKIKCESTARNRDDVLARNRARYHQHRDVNLVTQRERMAANRDKYNANRRAKRAANLIEARRKAQADREANRARYRGYAKKAWEKATPQRRLRNFFTAAICHSLQGRTKGGRSWESLLGYSAADLRAHLERQFERGMNWDNYGEWHVDHILPVASFSFASPDDPEFKACWALANLRPLWGTDNLCKSDKRLFLL